MKLYFDNVFNTLMAPTTKPQYARKLYDALLDALSQTHTNHIRPVNPYAAHFEYQVGQLTFQYVPGVFPSTTLLNSEEVNRDIDCLIEACPAWQSKKKLEPTWRRLLYKGIEELHHAKNPANGWNLARWSLETMPDAKLQLLVLHSTY